MKRSTTAKLPKKTSAKVNDPDNPAWTEDMLGEPVLKRGRGPQLAPTKVPTSIKRSPSVEARLDNLVQKTGRTNAFYLQELVERGLQDLEDCYLNVPNDATAKSLLLPYEEKDHKSFAELVNARFKDLDAEDLPIPKRMPARLINFDDR
jgi:predicted DNA-binding protein